MKHHLTSADIDLDEIAAIETPQSPPWILPKPKFISDLRKYKKSDTNHLLIQQNFAEIKAKYYNHKTIYTDGSKDEDKVAAAAVFGQRAATLRLPSTSSIFTSGARAIIHVLQFIGTSNNRQVRNLKSH